MAGQGKRIARTAFSDDELSDGPPPAPPTAQNSGAGTLLLKASLWLFLLKQQGHCNLVASLCCSLLAALLHGVCVCVCVSLNTDVKTKRMPLNTVLRAPPCGSTGLDILRAYFVALGVRSKFPCTCEQPWIQLRCYPDKHGIGAGLLSTILRSVMFPEGIACDPTMALNRRHVQECAARQRCRDGGEGSHETSQTPLWSFVVV